MPTTTQSFLTRPAFVVDLASMISNQGRQLDWDKIPSDKYRADKKTVTLNGAVDFGGTTLTVDALEADLPAGTVLDFGTDDDFTVTINDADVNAGETAITVVALPGKVPAGTVLKFSGGGAGFALVTADAAAGATSLTVEALPEDIDNAATAPYTGGRKLARVTTIALAGATSVTVDAIAENLDDNDVAYYGGTPGSETIPAGTVFCELSSGKVVPRVDRPGSETAAMIAKTPMARNDQTAAVSGFGFYIGGVIFENLLPEADSGTGLISSTYKTELEANLHRFIMEVYADDRA